MAYIKNISHEEVLHLADQVSADKGQIVSKTLAQNDHVTADAVPLPQGGRLRYEKTAFPITSERIHAYVKKE